MEQLIGIFRGLRPGEELNFESKIVTPAIFLKEAETKTLLWHSRQEIPIALAYTNVYLTNQRLIFLVLYQLQATELGKRGANSRLSGVAGTWFEMPLTAINQAAMRPLQLFKGRTMRRFLTRSVADSAEMLARPAVELVYNQEEAVGRTKDYIQAMLKMGFLRRIFTKVDRVSD